MGLTLITLKAFKEVSRLGLDTALIQRTEDDVDRFRDTVWSLQTLRGLGIAAIAPVTAPLLVSIVDGPGTRRAPARRRSRPGAQWPVEPRDRLPPGNASSFTDTSCTTSASYRSSPSSRSC